MNQIEAYKQFSPMIQKATWQYYKKYHIDREDIEAQAIYIFCKSIETYNEAIANFSTYLFNQLQMLNHFCKYEYRKRNKDVLHIKTNGKRGHGKNQFIDRIEIPETAYYQEYDRLLDKMEYDSILSGDAKEIVEYLCSREWEDNLESNWFPRFSYIKKMYLAKGWNRNRINKAWEQIRQWWIGSNKDQFCLEV